VQRRLPRAIESDTFQRSQRVGLLLVGHGTRSQQGADEFRALARLVQTRIEPIPVAAAFLEMAQPTIDQGLAELVARGARHVVVLPLLLFAAGHVRRDIPEAIALAAGRLAADKLTAAQADHLGSHPAIVDLSRRRLAESLQGRAAVAASNTALLMVGRGSYDESATVEMHRFARLCAERSPLAKTAVAFLAMARPSAKEVLGQLAAQGFQRIVVQPQLLFAGELLDGLRAEVRSHAIEHPDQEWIVTPHLGQDLGQGGAVDKLLARAVLDRYSASQIHVVASSRDG
jgi:sirohydrochlorin cobaltochelatase